MTKPKKTFSSAPMVLPDIFENDFTVKVYHLVSEAQSPELVKLGDKTTDYQLAGTSLTLKHKVSDDVVLELRRLVQGQSRLKICISYGSYTRVLVALYISSKCDKASKYNATPLLFTLSAVVETDHHV